MEVLMSDPNPAPRTGVDEQRIRERAYALWVQANCPDGQAEVFWSLAQQQVSMREGDHDETIDKRPPVNDLQQVSPE
jgi:hypothetical protein